MGNPDNDDAQPSRRFAAPESVREWGWYAFAPDGVEVDESDAFEVHELGIVVDEHAGPWTSDEGVLSGFEELHGIGVSRKLYDDVMTWHEKATSREHAPTDAEQQRTARHARELRARLQAELPHIKVRTPRERWTTRLYLLLVKVETRGVSFVGLDHRSHAARTLRRLPQPLVDRLASWQATYPSLGSPLPEGDPAVEAWRAVGREIAAEVQEPLGPDYEVRLYPP